MSRTYEIICKKCKKSLWIGQGFPDKRYIYKSDEHIKPLENFLFDHLEHDLFFADSERLDGFVNLEEYEDISIK